jgi:uncharacterized protein YndB with AHSA1/START domain
VTSRKQTFEVTIERTIPAPPPEVFDAWLSPQVSGTIWNAAEKFVMDPKVDGLFYWTLKGTAHYGRFTEVERPARMGVALHPGAGVGRHRHLQEEG